VILEMLHDASDLHDQELFEYLGDLDDRDSEEA